jgi:mono/diheme cytochrome c family protein
MKVLVLVVGALLVLVTAAVAIRQGRTFSAPNPDVHAKTDPQVVARGRYLVEGPAHCAGCHRPGAGWSWGSRGDPALPRGLTHRRGQRQRVPVPAAGRTPAHVSEFPGSR